MSGETLHQGQQPPALNLREVTVRYGGVVALTDVSFMVPPGQCVAVIGPNGAGKSTLLNAVSGISRGRVTGSIEVAGRQMDGCSAYVRARSGVGRSFQDPALVNEATVAENVLLGAHAELGYGMASQIFRAGMTRRREQAARERVLELLEIMGIADKVDLTAGHLAFGTRKLVDIARAVIARPALLLLDEPTSGLDSDARLSVIDVLERLGASTGAAIVMVEHHMDVVQALADVAVVLDGGRVASEGLAPDVLADMEQSVPAFHDIEPTVGGEPSEQRVTASPSEAGRRSR